MLVKLTSLESVQFLQGIVVPSMTSMLQVREPTRVAMTTTWFGILLVKVDGPEVDIVQICSGADRIGSCDL